MDPHYTPETKEQSKQWTKSGESALKKTQTVPLAGKIMATVFWDSRDIIFTDYLEKGRTITGQYYADLLDRFDAELKKKRPHLAKKKVLFHHNNAPASFAIAMAKLVELRYELLSHPPYSPEYSPEFGPLRFLFISKHEKNGLAENALHQMRKSSPKQRPILRSSTNHIF